MSLLLLPGGALGSAGSGVGILVQGSAPARPDLVTTISGLLQRKGWPVLAPREIRERLARIPAVQRAFTAARLQISAAEESTLRMERAPAIAAALRAVKALQGVAAHLHASELWARAHVTLALAHLLVPEDPARARASLALALQAEPGLQPDADRFSPRVVEMLSEVRQRQRRSFRPSRAALQTVARLAELHTLVWVALDAPKAGSAELQVVVHDREGQVLRELRRTMAGDQVHEHAGREVAATLRQVLAVQQPGPSAASPLAEEKQGRALERKRRAKAARPWYRSPWLWAIAGAVAVGTGAALAIGLTRDQDPPKYQLHIHF